MAQENVRGLVFDRDFWPKTGLEIPSKPYDLADLWNDFEDQACTFVAEALVHEHQIAWLRLDVSDPIVEVSLWPIGGDTITFQASLCDLLKAEAATYKELRSEEQAQDARERLASLEKIERVIARCKQSYVEMLESFTQKP